MTQKTILELEAEFLKKVSELITMRYEIRPAEFRGIERVRNRSIVLFYNARYALSDSYALELGLLVERYFGRPAIMHNRRDDIVNGDVRELEFVFADEVEGEPENV